MDILAPPVLHPASPSASPYDEMHEASGALRPHWHAYVEHQERLGTEEAKANWTKTKELLRDNGASYNTYRDSKGEERPFRLSPIPVMLSNEDWQRLSSGIAQRARLLGALLGDLYGPARTLVDGDLPSELVYTNPYFLRPLHGLAPRQTPWLSLYAVELIRAPDGRFYALEDSTQAPSGMGYALENRTVVAQTQSSLVRQCGVERLTGYFPLFGENRAA